VPQGVQVRVLFPAPITQALKGILRFAAGRSLWYRAEYPWYGFLPSKYGLTNTRSPSAANHVCNFQFFKAEDAGKSNFDAPVQKYCPTVPA
jgi:hypothetical protein